VTAGTLDIHAPARVEGRHGPWIVVATVLALGIGALGWTMLARSARSALAVDWAGSLSCTGTRMVHEPGQTAPGAVLQPSMRCTLPVRIVNQGWAPLSESAVLVPAMGPRGTAAVHVASLGGRTATSDPHNASTAVFDRKRTLAPGESDTFALTFTYRPGGCTQPGTFAVTDLPVVRVSALGLDGLRASAGAVVFHGTVATGCAR